MRTTPRREWVATGKESPERRIQYRPLATRSGRNVPMTRRATRRRSRTRMPGARAATKWVKRSGISVPSPEHPVLDAPAEETADRPEVAGHDENRQRVIQGTLPDESRVYLYRRRRQRPGARGLGDGAHVG